MKTISTVVLVFLLLPVITQFIFDYISNHQINITSITNVDATHGSVMQVTTILIYYLLFFVRGIVVGSNATVFSAIKLSCKASIKYFPRLLKLHMIILFWICVSIAFIYLLGSLAYKYTNLGDPLADLLTGTSGQILINFYLSPLLSVIALVTYTSWAAVFRDGSMKI